MKPIPPDVWLETESEPDGDYDELWPGGYHHRKWVACIGEPTLKDLIRGQALDWVGCQTLGSLGVPTPGGSMALGCYPAIGFECHDEDHAQTAYITPYVVRGDGETPVRKQGMTDRDWDYLEKAFLARYVERHRHLKGPYTISREARLMAESRERSKHMVFSTRD